MATTWSRLVQRYGVMGLFTCATGVAVWQGCAGTNTDYVPPDPNGQLDGGGGGGEADLLCNKTPEDDVPDTELRDNNCDGIDGDALKAIFVAPEGNDMNLGTRESPVKTIAKAIVLAKTENAAAGGQFVKNAIYLSKGDYPETVALETGISIYGGYDQSQRWARNLVNVSRITNVGVALRVNLVTKETHVEFVTLQANKPPTGGASTYAVLASNSTGPIFLRNNILQAADGADGAKGTDGLIGPTGLTINGKPGLNGCNGNGCGGAAPAVDGTGAGSSGGGGAVTCHGGVIMRGGNGGPGGVEAQNGFSGLNGNGSQAGTGGPGGGYGGSTAGVCSKSSSGTGGNPGAFNGHGLTGGKSMTTGNFTATGYDVVPANGGSGTGGLNGGSGGGGGGGGGVVDAAFCDADRGGGGGGGGAGGCGATAGTGGGGGGSSFAIYTWMSNLVVNASELRYGSGGRGGDGGRGASGSGGGTGGDPGGGSGDDARGGGGGGSGGVGGNSGAGAGGSGGNAYGIYGKGSSVQTGGLNFVGGASGGAGVGGVDFRGQAPNGTPGLSGNQVLQ